jgi:uncharacterized protein (UPF0332 family)
MTDLAANAKEAAEEARVLFDAGLYSGACSRAYYAMFNTARALLLLRDYPLETVKTHKSVLRLFSLEFVQQGTFKPELARALRRAADARHVADYEGGVTREQAAEVMVALDAFMSDSAMLLDALARGRQ